MRANGENRAKMYGMTTLPFSTPCHEPSDATRIPLEMLETIIDAMDQRMLAIAALICAVWYH